MYDKGKAFLVASILVKRNSGDLEYVDYVVLHLLCQGTENVLKGLLLLKDFKLYWPRLRKMGHDLTKVARATAAAYGRPPPRGAFAKELAELSKGYHDHQYRYGGLADLLIRPQTRKRKLVAGYMYALIVLRERAGTPR